MCMYMYVGMQVGFAYENIKTFALSKGFNVL